MGTVSCISWLFVCNVEKRGKSGRGGSEKLSCLEMSSLMVAGGVLVVKGSDFAVSGATEIARYFGMSERFIGLTIVALGTSLPELVTSVTAAKRGNAGIAIGNIVGSNIFNILFVIGTAALICPVPFETKFIVDTGIAILAGLVLWIGTYKNRELRKTCGVVMLLCYAGYFAYLCVV